MMLLGNFGSKYCVKSKVSSCISRSYYIWSKKLKNKLCLDKLPVALILLSHIVVLQNELFWKQTKHKWLCALLKIISAGSSNIFMIYIIAGPAVSY